MDLSYCTSLSSVQIDGKKNANSGTFELVVIRALPGKTTSIILYNIRIHQKQLHLVTLCTDNSELNFLCYNLIIMTLQFLDTSSIFSWKHY